MTTREKALEYIDRCTQRCGFVILPDGVRNTMADAFCLGYEDMGNECDVMDRADFAIRTDMRFKVASSFIDSRTDLIDLYEAGYRTRLQELKQMEEFQEEQYWRERMGEYVNENYDFDYGDVKY